MNKSRPGCNPGGGSFAPGWSLYSLPGLFSCPSPPQLHSPGGKLYHRTRHSRPQSHERRPGYSTIATPPGRCTGRTEPPQRARATAPEKGNRRKGHLQPHRATPRRRGYSYTITGIKAATEPHSGAQRATPPGVQSRPERRRPCPGLLYHAKALIGQPDSVQIFVPFSAIFPGSVPLSGRVS